jgi:cytochrome b subunit of formate dehydrogenase
MSGILLTLLITVNYDSSGLKWFFVFLFVIFAASGIAMTFIGSFFYLYTLSPYPSSPMKKMI